MQKSTMESASWQRPLYGFKINQKQAKIPLKSGFSDGLGGVFLLAGICLSLFNLPESLTKGNPHVEMSVSIWGNPLIFILNSTLLSMATIIASRIFENKCCRPVVSLMSFYGANTIIVLCLHGTILKLFQIAFKPFHLSGTVYAIGISVVCLAILYPIIKFINSELPNMIGRK